MSDWLDPAAIADIALVVLALEFALVSLHRRRAIATMGAILPGAFLLLALRAALAGDGWWWVTLWLAASLPVHLADMWLRLRQALPKSH